MKDLVPWGAMLVSVALLCSPSASSTASSRSLNSLTFVRQDQTSNRTYNVLRTADSPLFCGATCLGSSACRSFCHSKTASACYVTDESLPPVPVMKEEEESGLQCYEAGECPVHQGYQRHGDRCVKLYTEPRVQEYAKNNCIAEGGHLFHNKDIAWDQPTLLYLTTGIDTNNRNLWLGADDLKSEGDFVWSDGTSLASNASTWLYAGPNNANGNEHCVRFELDLKGLNDVPCTYSCWYVCQIDM